jgi:cell division septal protein FtsQ
VNGVELEKAIRQRNYQIEQVRVERSLLGGLRVTIREQQATLQWRSGSSVFVLSGNGVAYAELSKVDGKLPAVEDSTNLPVKTGQKIVPSSFVGFVVKIKPQLDAAGIKAEAISVSETTTEVSVKTNKGFIMKLDTTRSLESQVADYKAIAAKKIVPKEYVDLRIAGKVFYK